MVEETVMLNFPLGISLAIYFPEHT